MSFATTIYRGHELVTTRLNRREQPDTAASVRVEQLESRQGSVALLRPSGTHTQSRPFLYFLEGRTAISDFTQFLARRRGRYSPVWVPTGHCDLELAAAIGASDTDIDIQECGYTDNYFPSESRRHLAFISPDASIIARRVTASVDNGDGTETLTIESALGVAFPTYGTLVSFLVLARLADDAVTVHWHHPTKIAEAKVRYVEIPRLAEWTGEFPEDPA